MISFKKIIFIFPISILLIFFEIQAQKLNKAPQSFPNNSLSVPQGEASESAPGFDRNNPQAKGVILSFKHWPLDKGQSEWVIKKLTENGLKKKSEYPIFKAWVF